MSRGRRKGRGGSRLLTEQGAWHRAQSQESRIMTWAKGRCLTNWATHPGTWERSRLGWAHTLRQKLYIHAFDSVMWAHSPHLTFEGLNPCCLTHRALVSPWAWDLPLCRAEMTVPWGCAVYTRDPGTPPFIRCSSLYFFSKTRRIFLSYLFSYLLQGIMFIVKHTENTGNQKEKKLKCFIATWYRDEPGQCFGIHCSYMWVCVWVPVERTKKGSYGTLLGNVLFFP